MSGASGGLVNDVAGPWATPEQPSENPGVNLPFVDHIWRARGEMALDAPMSAEEAFARLDPLFQTDGTTYAVEGDTLAYTKRNPAPQDKLATFTRGHLRIEQRATSTVLRFDLSSTALLLSFLAPLFFLSFSGLAITLNAWEKANIEASEKDKKDEDKPKPVKKLNPVDEFLGAPAPDDPNKKKDKDKDKDKGRHSPETGYFLAGLFFAIFLVGRWLEPWLVRRRFRAALAAPAGAAPEG